MRSLAEKSNLLALLLFFLVGSLFYSNSFKVPFLFDDDSNIRNKDLQLTEFSWQGLGKAMTKGHLKERPIANLSFALNYYISAYNVVGYHVVNVVIHCLAAFFLFLLLKATLALPAVKTTIAGKGWLVALCASGLWLVHPLHTQSVTYIVQRMNSMSAMFYILALLLYVHGRLKQEDSGAGGAKTGVAYFAGSFLAGLCAIGSKEIAVTLPLFIGLYEWYFFKDLDRQWLRRKMPWLAGLLLLLLVAVLFYTNGHPFRFIANGYAYRDFTLQERLLTQPRVVLHYLSLLFFPHPSRLLLDYNFPLSQSLWQPVSTLLSFVVVGGMFLGACFVARRHRLVSFALLWFLGNLVIESSVVALEIIFEHRIYLPSMFLSVLLVLALQKWCRKNMVLLFVVLLVMSTWGLWTYQRNAVWADPVALWLSHVQDDPQNPRAHNNLGKAYFLAGDLQKAKDHFVRALELEPEDRFAQDNIGVVLEQLGDLAGAEIEYRKMIKLESDYSRGYRRLGDVLHKQGKLQEALQAYERALKFFPENWLAHKGAGRILIDLGRVPEAIKHFEVVFLGQPDDPINLSYYGEALDRLGNGPEAVLKFKMALGLAPDMIPARFNLAQVLLKLGKTEEALIQLLEVEKRKPDLLPALHLIALLFSDGGRYGESAEYFKKMIKIVPTDADLFNNLGVQLLKQGEIGAAKSAFTQALEINAAHQYARRNLEIVLRELGGNKTK
ncbi:MAG: tetratricopeptide repeat protein [Desulfobulbaceae bacterium]|nr:tetratricopeptide repeat protein [Desulfobulbaceae bacterium]